MENISVPCAGMWAEADERGQPEFIPLLGDAPPTREELISFAHGWKMERRRQAFLCRLHLYDLQREYPDGPPEY